MKKTLRTVFLLSVIAACFAACKAHERCPAYGKVNSAKVSRGIAG